MSRPRKPHPSEPKITPQDVDQALRQSNSTFKTLENKILVQDHRIGPAGLNCWECGERYPCPPISDLYARMTR